ncbi:MAG TPA: type II CAAX endopeptidase family protein [Feifaniaceae bacterium]|nr:type II CAAX endopeptidase family protein [Feifaniaceae bacterium]
MKPSAPLTLATTRKMNVWMLVICIGMLILGQVPSLIPGAMNDLVRLYAFNALIVEIACLYLPASVFVERNGGKSAFGFRRVSGWEWAWAVLIGIGAFFLVTAVNGFLQLLWETAGANTGLFQAPIPTDGGWRLLASIFLIAIIPAFAEETLFRGALLHAWLPQGKVKALWHTAVLFSLIHLQPAAFPAYLLLSLLLGGVTLLTDSVYPAMAVHAVNNLLAVLITHFAAGELAGAPDPALTAAIIPGLLFYLVLGSAACFSGYRGLRAASAHRRQALEGDGGGEFRRLEFDVLKPEENAQPKAPEAPAAQKKGTGALVATYVILGLINLAVLLLMFIELPQALPV